MKHNGDRGETAMAGEARRVRLLPLDASAYEYHGGAAEVPAVEALLGVPVRRQANGDIMLSCPVPRGKPAGGCPEPRTAVLRPGMVVVRFAGEKFRFAVMDAALFGFTFEPL